jgi:hypothetical protein
MLLYITAEDVFGGAMPERRGPRPLHTLPATLSGLYDLGMRHHLRRSVLCWPEGGELQATPDWRFDRLVIRIALYCRERLGLEPGTRAAVFGPLSWLWPAVELAIQGFGATSVGIEHGVDDAALVAALRDAGPRVVFATHATSSARLLELRAAGLLPQTTLVGVEGGAAADDVLPISRLLELGGTLDTPERAQAFRATCRGTLPEAEALWHVGALGVARLTHAQAIARVEAGLRLRPPAAGDIVYLQRARVTLAARLALAAFVGDGLTQTVLARDDAAPEDVARLRPHGMRVAADWLEAACRGCAPRWPASLDRPRARRRLQAVLGNRLRWVEVDRPVSEDTAGAIAAAAATLIVDHESERARAGTFGQNGG